MSIYRLCIWSDRGRIERDIERERDDALECIHAAGILAADFQGGKGVAPDIRRAGTVQIERTDYGDPQTASLVDRAHSHLQAAWRLLSDAGAQEAAYHVDRSLRLSTRVHDR